MTPTEKLIILAGTFQISSPLGEIAPHDISTCVHSLLADGANPRVQLPLVSCTFKTTPERHDTVMCCEMSALQVSISAQAIKGTPLTPSEGVQEANFDISILVGQTILQWEKEKEASK